MKIDPKFSVDEHNYKIWLLILAVVIWLTDIAAVKAGDVRFYNMAGMQQFSKPLVSIREGRFKHLESQQHDFSCGAATVTTILKYAYHLDLNEQDVIRGMWQVSDPELVKTKGFSLLDIRRYVETLGLRGRGYHVSNDALDQIRIPTITLLDLKGYKHFVVLKRVIGDTVYVGDPALGNRTMKRQVFLDSWNGTIFAIVGKGFDRSTVLSRPEQPLTAKRFLFDKSPISKSELLDFGFTASDMF
ncbi:C39 family peptidase [Maricurvus nonylphenolicus]|uniref:C39 family peptidase n=1 Tax=Maricurvus nonylphenolicus TaxID=1008307 RepID=UPI0036F1A21C